MAVDVVKAISANAIKNGTLVVQSPLVSFNSASGDYNAYVSNNPTLTQIENRYTERFDDEGYYTA